MWKDVVQGSQKAFMYQCEIAIWQLPELQKNEGSSHHNHHWQEKRVWKVRRKMWFFDRAGHTRWGPLTTISGFISSYTHLQPWLNRVCWGYNYLITRVPGPFLYKSFKFMSSKTVIGSTLRRGVPRYSHLSSRVHQVENNITPRFTMLVHTAHTFISPSSTYVTTNKAFI